MSASRHALLANANGRVVIYDVKVDEFRYATQRDIDLLESGTQAYGRLRSAVQQVHDWSREDVARILKDHEEAVACQR